MENHCSFNGKTHYKWPFSIAMLVITKEVSLQLPEFVTKVLSRRAHGDCCLAAVCFVHWSDTWSNPKDFVGSMSFTSSVEKSL